MILCFKGDISGLSKGIDILKEELGFETSGSGLAVHVCRHETDLNNFNASKCLMWQDILGGLFDMDIEGQELDTHYDKLAKSFGAYKKEVSRMSEVFEFYEKVASVLSIKAQIGIKIAAAYRSKNKEELERLMKTVLPELSARTAGLKNFHRDVWMKTNKAFGWEAFDLRYGCLINRIDTAIYRLSKYLKGEIESIPELEEERRFFRCKPFLAECNLYAKIYSSSRSSMVTIPVYML